MPDRLKPDELEELLGHMERWRRAQEEKGYHDPKPERGTTAWNFCSMLDEIRALQAENAAFRETLQSIRCMVCTKNITIELIADARTNGCNKGNCPAMAAACVLDAHPPTK